MVMTRRRFFGYGAAAGAELVLPGPLATLAAAAPSRRQTCSLASPPLG